MKTPTLTRMNRWAPSRIEAAIRSTFIDQQDDIDFTPYEQQQGVLLRANSAMTPELVSIERQYQQFGLVEVEYKDFQKFPVPGVFTQGIEGYAVYRGNLYRLLNIARLVLASGALKCALFTERGES